MKNLQDSQNMDQVKPLPNESEGEHKNQGAEALRVDSASTSISSSDNKKVSREDIELVQHLIERCLQLYMSQGEVVTTLLNRARIEPGFTTLVWQKLEEENSEFFRAYYIRLKLKKQIILFNHLLEHQLHLMKHPMPPKVPMAPVQNGIHPMPGYPVLQQPPMPAPGQPHLDSMNHRLSSCHVVNGVPAPGNYNPIRLNTTNDAMSSVSEMAVSPASASSGHFPFAPSEISGMDMDNSMLDTAFTSDVGNSGGLDLGMDEDGSSKNSIRTLGQIPWNFSLSDLTADLTNLEDLGPLGNYTGSPFLPSESDLLLDYPEKADIDEYFVDNVTGTGSDEDKS